MSQIIYLEITMTLLVNSQQFKHQAQIDTFLEDGFTEKETIDGLLYYVQKEEGE